MSIFREMPPTAGMPLSFGQLMSAFSAGGQHGSLEEDFAAFLGNRYARITASGTAAFYIILETLKNLSKKSKVIIPSYTCPLVPLAVKRAGLKVEVCDIAGNDFDFNYEELERICGSDDDILAIVATHLGGIPVDMDRLMPIASVRGIFVVEDCAQALGVVYKGRPVGAVGDIAFFSLCRGKGLTIYEGGVITAKDDRHREAIDRKIGELERDDKAEEALKIIELAGYSVFYSPGLFWFAFRLPQIFWNLSGKPVKAAGDYYGADFPVHRVSALRKAAGHANFHRVEADIKAQRMKAARYMERLEGARGIKFIKEPEGSRSNYPFLTALFDDAAKRNEALEKICGLGLGASIIYLYAITGYGYLLDTVPHRQSPGAEYISNHAMTLSTNHFMSETDIGRVSSLILDNILRMA